MMLFTLGQKRNKKAEVKCSKDVSGGKEINLLETQKIELNRLPITNQQNRNICNYNKNIPVRTKNSNS